MTIQNKIALIISKCHPELVSGSYSFSKLRILMLAGKMLKQVQHDSICLIVTVVIMLHFTSNASAAVLDSSFVADEVKKELIFQLKQQYSENVEVEIEAVPYKSIKIPDGKTEINIDSNFKNINSSLIVRVNIFVDGIKVRCFGVRAKIKIYDRVWVAKDWIKKGDTLSSVALEQRDISSVFNNAAKKDFDPAKYIAKRNIRPGDIINPAHVEGIPTIVKGSPVSLIFKTPLTSVTIPAIALSSGKTGDYIKVRNKAFKKNYVGKIIGNNLVLVYI